MYNADYEVLGQRRITTDKSTKSTLPYPAALPPHAGGPRKSKAVWGGTLYGSFPRDEEEEFFLDIGERKHISYTGER